MAEKKLLTDSSFLYALADRDDKYHQRARRFARDNTIRYSIPEGVFTEVTYFLRKSIGKHAELIFLQAQIRAKSSILALGEEGLERAYRIMTQYPQFDFVDCCILAIAERENITRICTFDRRDFEAFKPTHCEYLELLP